MRALPWSFVLTLWAGVWAATLYVAVVRWRTPRPGGRPPLATEGVMLWAMLPACLASGLSAGVTAPGGEVIGPVRPGVEAGPSGRGVVQLWAFTPGGNGTVASSPLVDGGRVFVAVAHGSVFRPFGKLYGLDAATGRKLWEFDDGGRMKQVFSSPCLADGRLYVGEGFHQDVGCKLYCLDAATGRKLWDFTSRGHTESSPTVADGRVYFGAGDDGVYGLDAATGEPVWHFDGGLHVDSNPAVVAGRLYAGAGVGDLHRRLELFCLDAATGTPVWRVPSDLPVWGSPAVAGEHVFFGLGNGNFLVSDEKPAGALVCVRARDGQRLWRHDVADGVLCRPAVDGDRVYFGARDGRVACLDRRDGRERWRRDMGSAVVASPTLARCPCCGAVGGVVVAGTAGRVCCLRPEDGSVIWTFDLTPLAAQVLSTPAVAIGRTDAGEHRLVYLGAGVGGGARAALYCLGEVSPARPVPDRHK